MAKSPKVKHLRKWHQQLKAVKHEGHLAQLLNLSPLQLSMAATQPKYDIFYIPKRNGGRRLIENPKPVLKKAQKRLNMYLQALYYGNRTSAAHGFVVNARKDADPRHIVSNATKHVGCKYLFNADLKDFFHAVKSADVYKIFSSHLLNGNQTTTQLLTQLTTFNGRLPMGAPTSPALSNLATIELDNELLQFCNWSGYTFTRYADDLSFSSQEKMLDKDLKRIQQIVAKHYFYFNPKKVKLYKPNDTKMVTGIQVRAEGIALLPDFWTTFLLEIQKVKNAMEIDWKLGVPKSKKYQKLIQQLNGWLSYAEMIEGADSALYQEADVLIDQLGSQPKDTAFGSMSWLDFPY